MNNKKMKFVTMFPRIENIHIIKDVGMIPYCMEKYYNYESKIVIYKNKKYDFLDNDVKISKMFFPLKKFNSIINCINFLLANSKKIDILHLFHIYQQTTMVSIPLYLLINPKGLIYIHMDSSGLNLKNDDVFCINGKGIKKHLKHFIYKRIIFSNKNRKRILFGMQDPQCEIKLKNVFPFDNIKYIPDGYECLNKNVEKIEKENTILFVGRVGSSQKRTDILLEAFRKGYSELNGWKLKLVGPIEKDFRSYLENYLKKYPMLKDKIILTGPIMNRLELEKEYKKAKVFCLPSDYESFGLVLLEALYNKCILVCSDIPSSIEILNNEEYGYLFEKGNSDSLAQAFKRTCTDEEKINHVIKNGYKYVVETYSYKKSLSPLNNWINFMENNK